VEDECGNVNRCRNVGVWENKCESVDDEYGNVDGCGILRVWKDGCGSVDNECGNASRGESVRCGGWMWECK